MCRIGLTTPNVVHAVTRGYWTHTWHYKPFNSWFDLQFIFYNTIRSKSKHYTTNPIAKHDWMEQYLDCMMPCTTEFRNSIWIMFSLDTKKNTMNYNQCVYTFYFKYQNHWHYEFLVISCLQSEPHTRVVRPVRHNIYFIFRLILRTNRLICKANRNHWFNFHFLLHLPGWAGY